MREMNHTGYAQILEESNNGSLVKSYVIGDDILSQSSSVGVRHFLYDGHGSTRMLADTTGAITSRYDFDAYGIMVGGNPNLANPAETDMLYSGEQFDADLQMQYLRARFYDHNTGRFASLDTFSGSNSGLAEERSPKSKCMTGYSFQSWGLFSSASPLKRCFLF